MRAGTSGLAGGGWGAGGAGARLFFFCKSVWDPSESFTDALSCMGGAVPGRVGGGGARRFFRSDLTDTPEMLLSERDGPSGTERGFTLGEFGVVEQPPEPLPRVDVAASSSPSAPGCLLCSALLLLLLLTLKNPRNFFFSLSVSSFSRDDFLKVSRWLSQA